MDLTLNSDQRTVHSPRKAQHLFARTAAFFTSTIELRRLPVRQEQRDRKSAGGFKPVPDSYLDATLIFKFRQAHAEQASPQRSNPTRKLISRLKATSRHSLVHPQQARHSRTLDHVCHMSSVRTLSPGFPLNGTRSRREFLCPARRNSVFAHN